MIKIKQKNNQKYICLSKWEIPYKVIKKEESSLLNIGYFNIPYRRFEKNGCEYINFFGVSFCVDWLFFNRKKYHYKKRNLLNDAYCKELLAKELKKNLGYTPNIDNPKTFNEKILWMKFNDHNPLITKCCDKYAVKDYVIEKVGSKYILPVIGEWDNANDINFDELPNQFVLKVNWSSGYNIIVKDKDELNIEEVIKKLHYWMQPWCNSYYDTFNWGYKNMKPIIYAEPYIEQVDGQVYDYKLFICNGKFEFLFIATDRLKEGVTYTFFDKEFNHLPFTYGEKPNADPLPQMPCNINKMIQIAEELAKPFKFVRVDFYEVNEKDIFVGEMTFYSGGGTLSFTPIEWDLKLGNKINI